MTLYELYSGPSQLDRAPIVLLAGGVDRPSQNRKTGPVAQLWVLRADKLPYEAVRDGTDVSVCGDCHHRAGPDKPRTCYVDLRHPTTVFLGERRRGSPFDLYGKDMRLGAYGDPCAVPLETLIQYTRVARSWLGYTEFWRIPWAQQYRQILMASTHSVDETRLARSLGWRTFRDREAGAPLIEGELECPYVTHQLKCIDCGLCNGATTNDGRKSISLEIHGSAARKPHRDHGQRSRLRVIDGGAG